MIVKYKTLSPLAQAPRYAHEGDACFDICTIDSYTLTPATLHPTCSAVFRTGLSCEVPEGHVLLLFSRSGMGVKGLRLSNCVGVVDSGYRGEVMVSITNDSQAHHTIIRGDRIAQGMILPIPMVSLEEVSTLSDSDRGEGGFGSTGR